MSDHSKRCILLMADDDADDRLLVREAFEESGFNGSFAFVEDGQQLLDYLWRRGNYDGQDASLPDLILLDLNMPRKDGYEALAEIKKSELCRRIPVVVLTTSDAEEDVIRTYDLGVNSFITKPSDYESLRRVADALKSYWLETVKLPGEH